MCSRELIQLLTRLAETLQRLARNQDGTLLGVIDVVTDDAMDNLMTESWECLHTDETIKYLLKFLKTVKEGCHALYNARAWIGISGLATITVALRGELKDELARASDFTVVKTKDAADAPEVPEGKERPCG